MPDYSGYIGKKFKATIRAAEIEPSLIEDDEDATNNLLILAIPVTVTDQANDAEDLKKEFKPLKNTFDVTMKVFLRPDTEDAKRQDTNKSLLEHLGYMSDNIAPFFTGSVDLAGNQVVVKCRAGNDGYGENWDLVFWKTSKRGSLSKSQKAQLAARYSRSKSKPEPAPVAPGDYVDRFDDE